MGESGLSWVNKEFQKQFILDYLSAKLR